MKPKTVSTYLLFGTAVSAVMLAVAGASAQNIYVANWYSPGAIYDFTPGGSGSTFYSGGLGEPQGMAFDQSGNLFVADALDGNIYKITTTGVLSTFASGLNSAFGLAFNSSGDLFVSDNHTGNIYEYTSGGIRTTFASGLSGPVGIAFDSTGDLFVSNQGGGEIYEYSTGGIRTTFASGLNAPGDIAFNAAGDLFVGYSAANGILEFSPKGVESTFVTGVGNNINGLAFNGSGDLFVADSGILFEITPTGSMSTFAGQLGNATGVAIQGETLPVPEPSMIALSVLGGAAILLPRLKK